MESSNPKAAPNRETSSSPGQGPDEEARTAPWESRSEGTCGRRVDVEHGRQVELPRMSKHLRALLEALAETLWKTQFGEQEAPQKEKATLAVPPIPLQIEKNRSRVAVRWDTGAESEKETFNKSQLKGVLRSLQSNGAGTVRVEGLGDASWKKSAREVQEIALDNNVIQPAAEGKSSYPLTRAAVRSHWTDGGFPLLNGAKAAAIHLSRKGQKLVGDLWAWEQAKTAGVPLPRARSNERLPSSYLSPSERQDPGCHRRRSLYQEEVGGTPYYAKDSLIVRGTPPELASKHRDTEDRIGPNLKNMAVETGTLFGRARPTTYVERETDHYRTQRLVGLENGMLVPVRECLFLMETFPDATWTTAHLRRTVEKGLRDEQKTVSATYPVVVGSDGTILGSLAPLKKRISDL